MDARTSIESATFSTWLKPQNLSPSNVTVEIYDFNLGKVGSGISIITTVQIYLQQTCVSICSSNSVQGSEISCKAAHFCRLEQSQTA
mmetsp:Transcript_49639/g.103569  ORF Transcript_49639/g.103569 Transcript_49639/m.103569 type:complete len:87 (+) Transcript_49639:117-377(+)